VHISAQQRAARVLAHQVVAGIAELRRHPIGDLLAQPPRRVVFQARRRGRAGVRVGVDRAINPSLRLAKRLVAVATCVQYTSHRCRYRLVVIQTS